MVKLLKIQFVSALLIFTCAFTNHFAASNQVGALDYNILQAPESSELPVVTENPLREFKCRFYNHQKPTHLSLDHPNEGDPWYAIYSSYDLRTISESGRVSHRINNHPVFFAWPDCNRARGPPA
ncbi:MAG: hypothetical protein RIC85_04165 [Gammaproteobacteria bacterium]